MDVDLLSKMVRELILDNDKVVLPGMGIFYAEIVPASFSDRGYTLNPPYRKLHFRAKDEQDDMLAEMYASHNSVGKDVAAEIISDFMQGLKQVLLKNKVIILPGLGRIRATKENNFFFVAQEDLDIYPDGFGLEPVSLKSHRAMQEVRETEKAMETIMNPEDPDKTAAAPIETPAEEPEKAAEEPIAPETPVQTQVQKSPARMPVEKRISLYFKEKPNVRTALIIAGAVILAAGLALLTFLVLAQACPDFIDSILYSPEQLEILNYGK